MSDDKFLQQFVGSFERLDDMVAPEGTPNEMLIDQDPNNWDSWKPPKWHPIYIESNRNVLYPLYEKLGGHFPEMYERLVLSYRWMEVCLRVVRLFANPIGPDYSGLTEQIFRDSIIADVLIPKGYIPFARSPINYDPICFNINEMTSENECPIIQFEHESILCDMLIGEHKILWDTFRELMTEVIFLDP
jgi:hypothetical protein